MFKWPVCFLVVSFLTGVIGYGGLGAGAEIVAKVLSYIFLFLVFATIIGHFFAKKFYKE